MIRIASSDSGRLAAAASRSKVSLRLNPASTSNRVRSVATSAELPLLDEASTEILKMAVSS